MLVQSLHVCNHGEPLVESGVQAYYGLSFWGMIMQDLSLEITADLMMSAECWQNGACPGKLLRCSFWDESGSRRRLVQELDSSDGVLLLVCYENAGQTELKQVLGPTPLGWGRKPAGNKTMHGRVYHLRPEDKLAIEATRGAGRGRVKRESVTIGVGGDGALRWSKTSSADSR